jgi:hypothetical protein
MHSKYIYIYIMSMLNSTIIHCHSSDCGGIGDFIRASLSFFSFCQRNNIEYYINFDENIHLKECFELIDIPDHSSNKNTEHISLLGGIYTLNDLEPVLDKIINVKNIYYIKTNALGFENIDDINKIKEHYFKYILKPSLKVIECIENIYSEYNIHDNNYISIHVRCGDVNMNNNSANNKDNRINLENDNIYCYYVDSINNFYDNYGDNLSIILHSDSQNFKTEIKNINNKIITLDVNIKHIAENIKDSDINSYISTVAEFYIISKANKIYMPKVYTGFSHIASIINNKPLYTSVNHANFNYLDNKNITHI